MTLHLAHDISKSNLWHYFKWFQQNMLFSAEIVILQNRLRVMAKFEMEMVRNVINMQEIVNKFITRSRHNWQSDLFFLITKKKKNLNLETVKSRKLSPISTQKQNEYQMCIMSIRMRWILVDLGKAKSHGSGSWSCQAVGLALCDAG